MSKVMQLVGGHQTANSGSWALEFILLTTICLKKLFSF